ncbi:hypothetical protein N0V83_006782 [Neocucurbitaria cava]|uniref:Uncharacterized protein n=1 Tax=Neocucurbitaria cava TaxID=798079 RepID=A0A9W8Y5Y2_9PLEO|nr:hypothetical protein N0V83_006782 [Neocucurbitaria cava]
MPVRSSTTSISEVNTIHETRPIEPVIVPDATTTTEISQLESQLRLVSGKLDEARRKSFAAEVTASDLQDEIDRMKSDHATEMAVLDHEKQNAVEQYRKLFADIPAIRRQAEEASKRTLQNKFGVDMAELEQEHVRQRTELQEQVNDTEAMLLQSYAARRKLEADRDDLDKIFRKEQRLRRETEERVQGLESELVVIKNDPTHTLSAEQKNAIEQYPGLLTYLHGDGTTENPGLHTRYTQARQTVDEQFSQLEELRMIKAILEQQILEQSVELDKLRTTKNELVDWMKEISKLIDKNISKDIELEELRTSMASKEKEANTAVEDIKAPGPREKGIIAPTKSGGAPENKQDDIFVGGIKLLASPEDTITPMKFRDEDHKAPHHKQENTAISGIKPPGSPKLSLCLGYVLAANERFIHKKCKHCELVVALPHWQRDNGLWIPKWNAHMNQCSFSPRDARPELKGVQKTTPVAGLDTDTKASQAQNKTSDSTAASTLKSVSRPVHKPPPTRAQGWPPESTSGMKKCKHCSWWREFNTPQQRLDHFQHEDECTSITCKNEGCGDVMQLAYFFAEHQKQCKDRTVDERKALSHTEKELAKRPETEAQVADRLGNLFDHPWHQRPEMSVRENEESENNRSLTPKGPRHARQPATPTSQRPRTPAAPKSSVPEEKKGGLMGDSKHARTTTGGLVGNSKHAPKETKVEKKGGLMGYSRWAPKKDDEGEKRG